MQRTYPLMHILFHSEDTGHLICPQVAKKVVLGPRFVGEGIPHTSDVHFQIALTSDRVAGYG